MERLEAIIEFKYNSKTVMPGEEFDCNPKDAKVLKAIGRAKPAEGLKSKAALPREKKAQEAPKPAAQPETQPKATEASSEPPLAEGEAVSTEVPPLEAKTVEGEVPNGNPEPSQESLSYQRRDLRAETGQIGRVGPASSSPQARQPNTSKSKKPQGKRD